MGRPRADSIEVPTRQRVLDAAEHAFADHGYASATLAEIGRRAGIRRPSLLYHFGSKEALYSAVVERTFAALTELLTTAMGSASAIEEMARVFAGHLRDHPHQSRIVVREMIADDGPGTAILRGQVAPLLDLVVGFLEAQPGLRPGLPVRAAVLHVASDALLSNSAGTLRDVMWGDVAPERTVAVARILFLAEEV